MDPKNNRNKIMTEIRTKISINEITMFEEVKVPKPNSYEYTIWVTVIHNIAIETYN